MNYPELSNAFCKEAGVESSTMMGSPCLRYRGEFISMMFDKQDALIIKVAPDRVIELVDTGAGLEFNYTGKRFKEWVLIPSEFEDDYEGYVSEALDYAKEKLAKKSKNRK
jgi:hypothetical protein